mmetsp:Transcript_8600/g.17337  ORF Transcript_8600/g.17337 Transcript_8600/m.17337 type:complete len:366 (+) Transcript_8600:263-1360(+)
MFRSRLRQRTEEVVTEEEVEDLKQVIFKLQKQLHQIVDQEIASNNEACGLATNGIVHLNIEMEGLTEERGRLLEELNRETEALEALERQCEEELDTKRKCQEDIVRLRSAMEAAKAESNTLQAEIEQSNYFQEQVDNETYYRLLADVQNLETEKERDNIRLRRLNSERKELQSVLDQLATERDALQEIAQKSKKELQDERMTLDMYKSHHGALHEHAERLGAVGSMDNVISSFKGFFNISRAGNEPEQPTKAVVHKNQKTTDAGREKERRVSGKSTPSNISPAAAAAVGGIAYTDSVPSSDFFRKTPKIFKIGGGGGGSRSSNPDVLKSITNEEREIHISDESSAQSSITMSDDGDEVTASMTES